MEILIFVLSFYLLIVYAFLFYTLMPYKTRAISGKKPKVSVIIPAKDDHKVIGKTVRNIRKSDYRNLEIIIVDGSKDDRTERKVRNYVDKIIKDAGRGKGHALKLGVEKAMGELIYVLDSDSRIEKNTVSILVSRLQEGYCGAVGYVSIKKVGGITPMMDRAIHAFFAIGETVIFRFLGTCSVLGKNFVLYRKDMKELEYENSLTEDIGISCDIYRKGKKLKYVPEAVCSDQSPLKFSHYWKRQERWFRGGLTEVVKSSSDMKSFKEYAFIYPVTVTLIFTPAIITLYLIGYLMFGNIELLIISLIGFLLIYTASIRSLDKKDIITYPFLFFLVVFVGIAGFMHSTAKMFLGIKTEWYKTPK